LNGGNAVSTMVDQDQARAQRIQELLAQLNELEQLYGRVPAEAEPRYAPSGEVNARANVLKSKLAELGIRLRWIGDRYVIEGGDDAGS